MEPVTIRYHLMLQDMTDARRCLHARRRLVSALVWTAVGGAAVAFVAYRCATGAGQISDFGCLAVGAAFLLVIKGLRWYLIRALVNPALTQAAAKTELEFGYGDAALMLHDMTHRHFFEWSTLRGFRATRRIYLLLLRDRHIIVPKRAFPTDAARGDFERFIRSKLAQTQSPGTLQGAAQA